MKKNLISLILFFCIILFINSQNPAKVNVEILKITDNYNKVLYGGRLEPKLLIKQYAPASGFITNVLIQEGSYVEKDTDILTITRKSSGGVIYNPTPVKSISDGIIVQILPVLGQEVFEKNEILTIADISIFKVNILVSDKDINSINAGDTCLVDKYPDLRGKISKISLMPESKSGLFKVETVFTSNKKLFVGQFLTLVLHINQTKGISIPFNNIINKYGKTYIFLAENNIAKLTEIKIINTFGNKVIIDGVKPGDKFITYSDSNLNDGDKIQIEENKNNNGNNKRQFNAR